MEEFVRQSLLFDFYGDLLTERQREIYEDYISENMSLSEIAEEAGISRQGVHDMIRRTGAALENFEEKLGLVSRFLDIRDIAEKIQECESLTTAKELSKEIVGIL